MMHKFKLQLLADPGTQALCQILGVAALYDPQVVSGAIEMKPHGQMWLQLKLKLADPARAALLLTRLKNLVCVHRARMVVLYERGWEPNTTTSSSAPARPAARLPTG